MDFNEMMRRDPRQAMALISQMQRAQQAGGNGNPVADVAANFLPRFQDIMSQSRNFNPASMGPLQTGLLSVARAPQLIDDGGMYPGGDQLNRLPFVYPGQQLQSDAGNGGLSQRPNQGGYNGGPAPGGLNRLPYVQSPGGGINRLPYVQPGQQLQSQASPGGGVIRDNAASLRPSIAANGRTPTYRPNLMQSPGIVPRKPLLRPTAKPAPMPARGDNGSATGFNQRLAGLLSR